MVLGVSAWVTPLDSWEPPPSQVSFPFLEGNGGGMNLGEKGGGEGAGRRRGRRSSSQDAMHVKNKNSNLKFFFGKSTKRWYC